jgi:trk system potassium uptake protein TrkA
MVLIIGCGRLGGSLAARLAAAGVEVTVVGNERRAFEVNLPRDFTGRTIQGMEIDSDVLVKAGIRHADVVAALGRDEPTNMMAAQVAKRVFKVPRVLVRIDSPELAELYKKQGFEVVSPILEGTDDLEHELLPQEAT